MRIPGVTSTDLDQLFAFSAQMHLDIAKTPGISGYSQSGVNLPIEVSSLFSLLVVVYKTKTPPLMRKVILRDWQ